MKNLHFVTGNRSKIDYAQGFFRASGIALTQTKIELNEIQGTDSAAIATSKAQQAWKQLGEPLFVTDSFWMIPALGGFPGPYMKYINNWFTPQDFLNLMKGKTDRTVIFRETIAFFDGKRSKMFEHDYKGTILNAANTGKYEYPSDAVFSFSKSGKSLAEELSHGKFFFEGEKEVWEEFIRRLNSRK